MMNLNFMPIMALTGFQIFMIVLVVAVVAATVALYFYGNKMQKKQEEAEKQMQIGAQTVSMLVIDKKIMKLKEAGFYVIGRITVFKDSYYVTDHPEDAIINKLRMQNCEVSSMAKEIPLTQMTAAAG